jgi:hypothetical protein
MQLCRLDATIPREGHAATPGHVERDGAHDIVYIWIEYLKSHPRAG